MIPMELMALVLIVARKLNVTREEIEETSKELDNYRGFTMGRLIDLCFTREK